ncbi:16S rRNA (uracil(1498)-N(3))-methyltransferase [Williamsia sp. M5A3_1d]
MTPPLFWIDEVPAVGGLADLTGTEGHHAVTVTRIVAGDRITLGDGAGRIADCEVVATLAKDRLRVTALTRRQVPRPSPLVTLVQALPKSDRSELAVEMATEAGVDRVVAWQSARCVSRWVGPREEKGLRKWRSAAATAAKQSRRAHIPEITGVAHTVDIRAIISGSIESGGVAVVLHEGAVESLTAVGIADATEVIVIVGPEGGIDPSELDDFTALGARSVRMGPEVLRTSTAGTVALGAIGAMSNRWGQR